jgi:1-acyl-sn-glycerol-3-phosphate acyltransferase
MSATANSAENEVIARRSPALCRFFSAVMRRRMRQHFHAVRIARAGLPRLPEGRAAIIYSNHPSWWDPALFIVLATTYFPGRPGYGPMDATALARYGFMRRIGIFGVEPDTRRGAADFLRAGTAILSNPDAMFWVTAEGAFADARRRPVRLRAGTAHLLAKRDDIVAVPLAIEYPFWTERLPEALCRFGQPIHGGECRSVTEARDRLENELASAMDALAADAMARDPGRFETVLRGRSGVGGIYDVFRRLRAAIRGEQFVAEHGGRNL